MDTLHRNIWNFCWPTGNNTEQVTCCGQYPYIAVTQGETNSGRHLNFIYIFKLPVAASSVGGFCQQNTILVGKHWFRVPVNIIAFFFLKKQNCYMILCCFFNFTATLLLVLRYNDRCHQKLQNLLFSQTSQRWARSIIVLLAESRISKQRI